MSGYASLVTFIVNIICVLHLQVYGVWGQSTSSSGAWGPWSQWSGCSQQCGPGLHDRTRSCLNGACRAGSEIQTRSCQIKACPASQPSFRQKACSKYDRRVFSGKRYVWGPYVHSSDSCKLSCQAKGISFYANLPSRVRDGELCQAPGHEKAICFRGVCKPVGCDDIVLSSARPDKCGVCMGDGLDCKTIEGVFTNNQLPRGINHVITIPTGSTSINITELSPSKNLLILQGQSGKTYLNTANGHPTSGTIRAAGTTFRYIGETSIQPTESVLSKGPTNDTIFVKLLSRGSPPRIKYSFSVPMEFNTQELRSGVIQAPILKTAPLYVEEKEVTQSAALQGFHRNVYETEDNTERTSTTTELLNKMGLNNERNDDVTDNPKEFGRNQNGVVEDDEFSAYSVELDDAVPADFQAPDEIGVGLIDPIEGSSSEVVSSYDINFKRGGIEVVEEDYGKRDGSNNYDLSSDNQDESDEDGGDTDDDLDENSSSIRKSDFIKNRRSYPSNTKTIPHKRLPSRKNEVDITYLDNDKMTGSDTVFAESNESNRDGVDTIYDTTTPPTTQPSYSNKKQRSFKIPKFSNSFTFASKYGRLPPRGKTRIRIGERLHSRRMNGGRYGTSALEASPTAIRKKNYFEEDKIRLERDRIMKHRQAMTDARNNRLQEQMEQYNRRLQLQRDKMRQRRKEETHRNSSQLPGLKSSPVEGQQFNLKISNGNAQDRVSAVLSASSPTSNIEKSVNIDATGKANRTPLIIKRIDLPENNKIPKPDYSDQANAKLPNIVPRVRPSAPSESKSASTGVNVIPPIETKHKQKPDEASRKSISRISNDQNAVDEIVSQTPRKIISRVSEKQTTFNDITSKTPRKLIPRVSENHNNVDEFETQTQRKFIPRISNNNEIVDPISSQDPRKIIPKVSEPENEYIPRYIPSRKDAGLSADNQNKVIPNSRRIIRPNINQPRYIPSERDDYVSALSSKDTNEIIPNRVETSEYRSGLPATGRAAAVNPPKTLSTADEVEPFSNNEWRISGLTECTHSCGGGVQQTVVVCVDTRTQAVVTDDNCRRVQRPKVKAVTCNKRPCPAQWIPSAWSSCTVTCGDGEQTRTVTCQARVSPTLNLTMAETSCHNSESPVERRTCNPQPCSSWSVGNWSQCSSDCGDGVRSRDVQCVGLDREELDDRECSSLKPDTQETCNLGACGKGWFFTEWPEQCPVLCGAGVLTRKVFCASEDGQALPESRCNNRQRPQTTRPCRVDTPCGGSWYTSPWSRCNVTCGVGSRTREVLCVKTLPGGVFAVVSQENCAGSPKPEMVLVCKEPACQPEWYTTSWGQCTKSCGSGYKTREMKCLSTSQQNSDQCPLDLRPRTREHCNSQSCRVVAPDRNTQKSGDESCKDKFSQCRIVKRARLCKYSYYKKVCCVSCS